MGLAWYGIGAGVGLAAATGAATAWRAAIASKKTARDPTDALALGLKPQLQLETYAVGDPEGGRRRMERADREHVKLAPEEATEVAERLRLTLELDALGGRDGDQD
jgi:hypothetical protein